MEVALELEDDVFFADLSKQISLLIMDDDEVPVAPWHYSSSLQGLSRTSAANQSMIPPTSVYDQTSSCRREMSKGTGVFIPKLSQPRRKNRQGGGRSFSSFNAPRTHKHHNSTDYHNNIINRSASSGVVPQFSHKNNSFNPKKF